MNDIYKELILEHFKHPRNFGKILRSSFQHTEKNALCGDEITVSMILKNQIIKNIRFEAKGCAICVASMSLLSEKIKNKHIQEIFLTHDQDIFDMLGVKIGKQRKKCALLGLTCLQNGLREYAKKER